MHQSQQQPMGQGPQRYPQYGMAHMPPPHQQQGPASMNPEANVFVPTMGGMYQQGNLPRPHLQPHYQNTAYMHQPNPQAQIFFSAGMPPMVHQQFQQHPMAFQQQHPGPHPGPNLLHFAQSHMGQMQPQMMQQPQQQQQQQPPMSQAQILPTPTAPNQGQPPMSMPHIVSQPSPMLNANIQPFQPYAHQQMASVGQQHAVPAPIQKRRSNAIAIVDPTTNKAIDVLAAKTATEATAATPVPRAAFTITIEAPSEVSTTSKAGSQSKAREEAPKPPSVAATPTQQKDDISQVAQELEQISLAVAEKKAVPEDVQVKKMSEPPTTVAASVSQQVPVTEPAPKINSVNLNNNVKGSEKSPIRDFGPTTVSIRDLEQVSPVEMPESNDDDFIEAKSRNSKKKNAGAAAKKVELIQKVPSKEANAPQPPTAVKVSEVVAPAQPPVAVKPVERVKPAPVKPVEPVKPAEPVRTAEPVRMAEPVKVVEPVKLAEPVKTVEPVLVPSVPPPSIIPERANHVKEATPEVVKKEVTPELEVTNHQVEEHPIIEVVEDVTVDGDLTKSDSQVKLKYEYNDGQWSPLNQEGKKQYDRNFLMLLKKDPMSLERPPNLPNLDIIRDVIRDPTTGLNTSKISFMMGGNDWSPSFMTGQQPISISRPSLTKRPSRDGRYNDGPRGGDNNKRQMMPPQKIIEVKIEKVELHHAENAWRPGKVSETANGDSQAVNDVLLRKARGILNKLCPQKFDILVEKFNELQIDNEEKLRLCIDLIFEKAVDEPGFSVAYARMCEVLQKKQVMVEVNGTKQPINFRKLLVTRCQQEFEQDYLQGLDKTKYEADLEEAGNDEAKKKIIQAEWEEKEMRARRRSLGNIRFIGELYKLKMLSGKIMHECVTKLLRSTDEESLECLCRLMSTVGKDLESDLQVKFSKQSGEDAKKSAIAQFDIYFKEVEKIIQLKSISSRVKFMLQDLVDLRRSQWKPRRDIAGPKTIEQIHKEAEREKTQNQLLNELTPMRNRDGGGPQYMRGGPNDRKKPTRGPNQSEDGWTNVQPSKASQRSSTYDRIDSNKIANLAQTRRVDADSIQLGPGRSGGWAAGSGSMRLSRTKEDSMPDTKNKFAMLNQHESSGPASLGGYSSMPPPTLDGGYDSRRTGGGPSRSMGMPGRSSRGASEESDRKRDFGSLRPKTNGPPQKGDHHEVGGPAVSMMAPQSASRPVPANIREVNCVLIQSELLRGKPDLPANEVTNQSKQLLDEFLNHKKEKEAIETVKTYFHPTSMVPLVEYLINEVLELKSSDRQMIAQFLAQLVSQHILLKKQYETGLGLVLKIVEDLIVDIPKMWLYLGELIAPMIQHNSIPMSFLAESNLSKENGFAGKYLAGVLNALVKAIGQDKAAEMWKASGLNIESFVNKENVKDFASSNKLEFTLVSGSSANGQLTPESVHQELSKLLANKSNSQQIQQWIESHVGERKTESWFIRVLVTAIAEASISADNTFLANVMKDQKAVLLYLNSDTERQKQALYALQYLMHRMEHPNRVLHHIFQCLWDIDVIDESGFTAWEKCTEPSEQEGKGVAITSTTQFFTWLREVDDDDDN